MRVGLKFAPIGVTLQSLRDVWHAADEAGFDHLWLMDHFLPLTRSATGWYQHEITDPVFESWTLLAAMAERTKRIRIGINVTGNLYRHPSVLAKMAATVDQLSGGRLEMGMGAAWAEREFASLGIPMPPPGERIDRLDEACQVLKLLWTKDAADFDGRYYRLQGAISEPKPLQRPGPPLWIGGSGERKTLRVVARHADVWNIPGGEPDEAARLSRVLDEHCAAVARDPYEIRRSVGVRFFPDAPDRSLATARAMVERGFTELLITVMGDDPPAQVEAAASVLLPQLRR